MEFHPSTFLTDDRNKGNGSKGYLIILNQPIHDFEKFAIIWRRSAYRICADGGANRLFELLEGQSTGLASEFVIDISNKVEVYANIHLAT